jgi:hypothetical protein
VVQELSHLTDHHQDHLELQIQQNSYTTWPPQLQDAGLSNKGTSPVYAEIQCQCQHFSHMHFQQAAISSNPTFLINLYTLIVIKHLLHFNNPSIRHIYIYIYGVSTVTFLFSFPLLLPSSFLLYSNRWQNDSNFIFVSCSISCGPFALSHS